MATYNIFIFATDQRSYPPIIFDSEGHCGESDAENAALITEVGSGDTIIWKISPSSEISTIDDIRFDSGADFFPEGLSHNSRKTQWSGQIETDMPAGTLEDYSIAYTVNDTQFIEDPKLQMKQ